jgi:FkbM family methyltransferase
MYFMISGRHISRNGFSLSNYGVWLASRPNDITYNFCLDASYGNRLERILHEVSVKTIFVDIGANIGVFSLVASQNPSIVEIHSFEPDLESFEFLQLNIQRNNATRIIPHNLGISRNAGLAHLSKNEGHSGASRIIPEINEFEGQYSSITLADYHYLNSVFTSKEVKYLVKVDVEGYEIDVLETLRSADFFPLIQGFFVEFDYELGKIKEVENFLGENSFVELARWGSDAHWDALWVKPSENLKLDMLLR